MATIALAATALFVAFLLWQGRDRSGDVSWATWIPTLWMMRCASRSLTLWLYPRGLEAEAAGGLGSTDGSLHDQVFFATLMLLAVIVLVRRVRDWGALIGSNGPLVLFFGYMLLSSLGWSPEPLTSLKRWFRTVGDVLVILVALTETNRMQAVSAILWRCGAVLVPLSLVLARFYPAHGVKYGYYAIWGGGWVALESWVGVTTSKNGLGMLTMLAALACVWRILLVGGFQAAWKQKRVELLLLAVSSWVMLGGGRRRSMSATSIILFLLGAALMWWLRRHGVPRRRVVIALFVVLMAIALVNTMTGTAMSLAVGSVTELAGRDSTFTGRTGLWTALIELGQKHPLLGAGFEAFWSSPAGRELVERPEFSWNPNQAHNGYLEVYLNLGLLGLLLIAVVCWRGLKTALDLSLHDRDFGQLVLLLFTITIVHNLTEASFTRPTHVMWFTFLLATLRIPWRHGQSSRRTAALEPRAGRRAYWYPDNVDARTAERPARAR
jgi:O-antigen ligase